MGIDVTEAVLLFVLTVLTVLLVVLGIQVYFILKEFKKTVIKANKVLDDTETITKNVSGPIASISSISNSLQASSVFAIIKFVRGILLKEKEEEAKEKVRK
jgi:sensor domain CHASE-containing protein